VVYGIDVKDKALLINQNGFDKVMGVGVPEFDHIFKPKAQFLISPDGLEIKYSV